MDPAPTFSASQPVQPYVSAPMTPSPPSIPMLPGDTAPQQTGDNVGALQPDGTGGLMAPSTPSAPGLPGVQVPIESTSPSTLDTRATTLNTVLDDNFANGIDPSKWGVNYPWGVIPNDPTQYAAYANSLSSDVFSTGANGLNIAIKPTSLDSKPAETGQIHSKQAFQYGYVEMTGTLPPTKGIGAAFWMMPADGSGTYRGRPNIRDANRKVAEAAVPV